MFISRSYSVLHLLSLLLARSLAQDNACSSQPPLPVGSGPVPTPDAPAAFYDQQSIKDSSNSAAAPLNYTLAYSGLQASSDAEGYQGYSLLNSYNVTECARLCNSNDRCTAFNILFERSPSVDPSGEGCTDPPSTTLIKCVLWSSEVSTSNAVNAGQFRSRFQVVIAGSNGYNKRKPPPAPGYLEPVNLGRRAITAPTCSNGVGTAITQIFTSTADPYNVTRAAQWCDTQFTRTRPCFFFNCYLATYAAGPQTGRTFGQICDLYSLPWGKEYAKRTQTRFDGPTLDISNSFAYTSINAPAACAAPPPA